jgi:hypothetical protein
MKDCTSQESCTKPNVLCAYPNCLLGEARNSGKKNPTYEELTAENERLQRVVEPTVEDIGYRVLGELFAKHGGEYLFIAYWSPDDLVIEEGDDADDVEFIIDFGDSRLSIRPNMATYITDKSIECASDWTQVKAHIEWMEANSNIPEAHLKREDGNG